MSQYTAGVEEALTWVLRKLTDAQTPSDKVPSDILNRFAELGINIEKVRAEVERTIWLSQLLGDPEVSDFAAKKLREVMQS